MSSKVSSVLDSGNQSVEIEVECHISNGLPGMVIVGFANKAIEESKERIRSAFASSSLNLPKKRITINLAPADLPKESTCFDLPIAVSILSASEQVDGASTYGASFVGELGLDGNVRPIRGIIAKLMAGKNKGFKNFFIPAANTDQAKLVAGLEIIPVKSLNEIYLHLTGVMAIEPIRTGSVIFKNKKQKQALDFRDISGQARAKRALEIAAAGGHNILMSGAPGTGKSMLAKATPTILPELNLEEILEITQLHSLASKNYDKIVIERPFRSPHHSSSPISVIGGGQYPRPGEISLAHHGILMFDEFPEFNRTTLEALRQPLEDRVITVARARDNITFPANFILVATANPCPCGFFGTTKNCDCLPHEINRYQKKLSGPILDRIDLYVTVDEIKHNKLLKTNNEESSEAIQKRVIEARERQFVRYKDKLKINSKLTNRDIKKYIKISSEAEDLLNKAAEKLSISARSYMRLIKVAQTIADLDSTETISANHISEALQYRHQPTKI